MWKRLICMTDKKEVNQLVTASTARRIFPLFSPALVRGYKDDSKS